MYSRERDSYRHCLEHSDGQHREFESSYPLPAFYLAGIRTRYLCGEIDLETGHEIALILADKEECEYSEPCIAIIDEERPKRVIRLSALKDIRVGSLQSFSDFSTGHLLRNEPHIVNIIELVYEVPEAEHLGRTCLITECRHDAYAWDIAIRSKIRELTLN